MLPVLGYWFGDGGEAAKERADQWLTQHPQMRHDLVPWAPPLVNEALRGGLNGMAGRARGRLALIMLLDPVPRLLYRGTAKAYHGDLAAQAHVLEMIAEGQMARLSPVEQMYAHLPLMHSENPEYQKRSMHVYTGLAQVVHGEEAVIAQGFLQQAREHHMILREFGRFPDRNLPLGRLPRPGEQAFLSREDHLWFSPQVAPAVV